jgi:hypothetical protein
MRKAKKGLMGRGERRVFAIGFLQKRFELAKFSEHKIQTYRGI